MKCGVIDTSAEHGTKPEGNTELLPSRQRFEKYNENKLLTRNTHTNNALLCFMKMKGVEGQPREEGLWFTNICTIYHLFLLW